MIASTWWRCFPSRGALLVPAFCIGLVALIWVGLFHQMAFERERAIEQREVEHDNLARLFEEHVLGVLTSASITLREIESEYRRQGARLDLAKYLHDRPELRPYRNISVVDRDGNMVLNSVPFTKPQSVRDTENFQYHVNSTTLDLFVAKPRLGVATHKSAIVVTRRMNQSDGTFGGITSVGIDPAYFSRFYDEISLGPDSLVTLVGRDGIARARRANDREEVGQDLSRSPLFTTHLPARQAGHGIWTGALEAAVTRLYSYRSVRGFPLVVVVGSSRDVTLAPVEMRGRVYRWWASGISVLILGFAVLVTLQRIRKERHEQALRESDAALEKAQAVAHVGSWAWHIRENRLEWSAEMHRIFGVPKEGFTGELADVIARAIHPDDRAAVEQANLSVIRDKKAMPLEYRVVWPDGTMRAVRAEAGELILDKEGNPAVLTGIVQDITDRRRAESALQESETRFRTLVEQAGDGFHLVDEQGRFLDVNNASCAQLGYSREELLQLEVYDIVPDLSREQYAKNFESLMNRPVTFESVQRRKDGTTFPVEVTRSIVQVGSRRQSLTLVRDITKRKRNEASIKESEFKYRLLFETANDGIFLVNAGGFLDCNQRAAEMYGLSKEKLMGRSPVELCPERQPDGRLSSEVAAEKMEAAFMGRTPMFEWQYRRADGVCFDVEITLNRIEVGGSACLQAIVRDITERKRLEELRLRSQKLESLGTLAGGIAHDFNNILLAINGNAKLALEDLGEDHAARQSVAEIAKAGRRAADLVRRILAFSRPQGETRAVMHLRPVLDEAVKLLRATLPATIEFRQRFGLDVPLVAADATQVHEAVVNLATNASHAIGERPGIVEFVLEPVEVNAGLAARVPGVRPGRYARLSVRDSGCGISEAMVGRIFDAFFTTKPVGQGTGLGLSIVHGIMNAYGGAIGVESALGGGSTFDLYFPAAEPQDEERPAHRTPEPVPPLTGGRRVLYIDDEEALVLLLGRVLERAGHNVTSFTDPQEALGAFRIGPQDYDIVVTDLSMPGMTGFDVAREVLSIRGDIPVLMTTGYVRPDDEERARAVGIRQVILKPNTVNELALALDRLFQNGNG